MGRVESPFQRKLIQEIRVLFPGCVILKNDANYLQGVPDLIVLWHEHYAMLECKSSISAVHQPNQDEYVDLFHSWSFSAFVYPQNKDQVLDELQRAFGARRTTRVSQRQ
jgi:hypothetical protein